MKLTKEDIGVDVIDSYPYPLTRDIKYIPLHRLREIVEAVNEVSKREGNKTMTLVLFNELFGEVLE